MHKYKMIFKPLILTCLFVFIFPTASCEKNFEKYEESEGLEDLIQEQEETLSYLQLLKHQIEDHHFNSNLWHTGGYITVMTGSGLCVLSVVTGNPVYCYYGVPLIAGGAGLQTWHVFYREGDFTNEFKQRLKILQKSQKRAMRDIQPKIDRILQIVKAKFPIAHFHSEDTKDEKIFLGAGNLDLDSIAISALGLSSDDSVVAKELWSFIATHPGLTAMGFIAVVDTAFLYNRWTNPHALIAEVDKQIEAITNGVQILRLGLKLNI